VYGGIILSNFKIKACQQSVHLTLGILRQSQAVSYAVTFFWLDGFAVPAPAQVTQTVGWLTPKSKIKYVFESQVSFSLKKHFLNSIFFSGVFGRFSF